MDIKELLQASFVNIDKPADITSHDACQIARKILGVEKTGHAGTLDPMVTGVLPIAVGKATRLLQYLKHDKEYIGVMDVHREINQKELEKAIEECFTGKIKQVPPVKSRVKRVEREREVFSFEIIEQNGREFLFKVHCEAGTYIRKLISDLGEKLGTGAHMTELRRTKAGEMNEKDSVTFYQLAEAFEEYKKGNAEKLSKMLQPIEIIAENMPKIHVKTEFLEKLYNGSPVYKEFIVKMDKIETNDTVAVLHEGKIVEIAKAVNQDNAIAKPETVIK